MSSSNQYSRSGVYDRPLRNSGPYEAIIVSHLDATYMGSLEVEILRYGGSGNLPQRSGELVTAKYLSPFYGVTPFAGLNQNDGYHQTQKSYGFWMIPPDPGSRVLVIFAEGNPANAYWIGCVQDAYMNFMIPDGRASTENTTTGTPENLKGTKLPVGEYSKVLETGELVDPTLFPKPYNKDFTDLLEVQGLLYDEARGLTTSSARREIPSAVYGFSTPGPLDKRQKHPNTEYGPEDAKALIPFNRLGGSSLVMDDGDDKFIRATHASDGAPLYVNKELGEEGGDETIPQNECIRIRTRTGHQILLHNSEDLIYITNSRGTAWIELTSDGKIDIHAEDSISIHTEQDFNFRAERDVNIEAGRNINMRASANWSDDLPTLSGHTSGNVRIESRYDTALKSGRAAAIESAEMMDLHFEKGINLSTNGNFNLTAQNIVTEAKSSVSETSGGSWYRKAGTTLTDQAENDYFTQIGGEINVNSNRSIYQSARDLVHTQARSIANNAAENFNIQTVGYSLDSTKVDLNGNSSTPATAAKTFTKAETSSVAAASVMRSAAPANTSSLMSTFAAPAASTQISTFAESGGSTGFTGSAAYVGPGGNNSSDAPATSLNRPTVPSTAKTVDGLLLHPLPRIRPGMIHPVIFDSIMKRVPQHEPWTHHENYSPQLVKPYNTDALIFSEFVSPDRTLTPDTFTKNKVGRTTSVFVQGSGGGDSSFGGSVPVTYNSGASGGGTQSSEPVGPVAGDGDMATVTSRSGRSAQVAAVFKDEFQGFINDLEATGYKIYSLGGFNRRQKRGGGGWSMHASAAAIDINPEDNPYTTRDKAGGYTITDLPANVCQMAAKWGLGWGGDWDDPVDAMHFSAASGERGKFIVKANGIIASQKVIDPNPSRVPQCNKPTKRNNT